MIRPTDREGDLRGFRLVLGDPGEQLLLCGDDRSKRQGRVGGSRDVAERASAVRQS